MKRTLFLACAAVLLAAQTPALAADLSIGDPAPELEVSNWIKGQAVDLAAAKGKQIVVLEFWAIWCCPCIESIPHLTKMQQEYADRGVVVVGVSPHDPGNTLQMVQKFVQKQGDRIGYTIAFDKQGQADKAFMKAAKQDGMPTAFVIDRAGRVAWIGHPLDAMDEALEQMVAGEYDIKLARKEFDLQTRRMEEFYDGNWAGVIEVTDQELALDPRSPDPWMAKLMVHTIHLPDPGKALVTARQAVAALADDAGGLAYLAGMLAEEKSSADQKALAVTAVARAVEVAPQDPEVRAAQYSVLAALGRDEEAYAVATETIGLMKTDARALGRFARVLSSPDPDHRCNALAVKAVELALAAEPEEPVHLETKFRLLVVCQKDFKAAEAVGRYLVEKTPDDATLLNNFAWRLLTEEDTKGKFSALALVAAEKSHRISGGDNWVFLDTLALAKFDTGSVAQAVEFEQKAIELCENDRALEELRAALKRFEEAQTETSKHRNVKPLTDRSLSRVKKSK